MRIRRDECLPKHLKRDPVGHEAQNISRFDIAVIVLVAKSNQYAVLQPLVADVQTVLAAVAPGQVIRVG